MAVQARFKLFKSYSESWEAMAGQVAEFLTTLGPGKVIGVSHSQEGTFGVIAVWYWEVDEASQGADSGQ